MSFVSREQLLLTVLACVIGAVGVARLERRDHGSPSGQTPAESAALRGRPVPRLRSLQPGERIDLNGAKADDLARLPGIGPRLAARIVEHRKQAGGFTHLTELDQVPGVGARLIEKLAPLLVLSPKHIK